MNIQTKAYETPRKPTKGSIQSLLEKLYNETNNEELKSELAGAFKYFQPTLPKISKNLNQWIALANRPYLHNAYSNGEKLIATDGHRIHMIPSELEKGYYDAAGVKLDIDGNFPDVMRAVPSKNIKDTFNMEHAEIDCAGNATFTLFKTRFRFNLKYLQAIMQKDKTVTVYSSEAGETEPVLFCFDDREAVLMPVNL